MDNFDRRRLTRRRFLTSGTAALVTGTLNGDAFGSEKPVSYWETVVGTHPAQATLTRLFPDGDRVLPVTPTGLTKADYLPVVAGIVDFFKQHQNEAGAIIDPYEKKERQYSTPAFALDTALLIAHAGRADLKDASFRAFDFALAALENKTTADGHADFYIPMMVHAHRLLLAHAAPTPEQRTAWECRFRALIPEKAYRDVTGGGNWNLVNVSGECLRRQDGLVAPDQRDSQAAYIERSLEKQKARMTVFGMYEDPNAPIAYDAFPRLWLEDVLAERAYSGVHAAEIDTWLAKGSLSTLLLLSPTGEWAPGGRSAFHQWNEAEIAVISEINAARWRRFRRPDLAAASKRAAHLALGSVKRWRRPTGELWIVKNHADPALRHGYEGYSFHSQYNLLAGAMLCLAYLHADDTIPEQPIPSERGGYVFDVRETFHKVCAAGGGAYVLIDPSADPHYDASGLLRFQRSNVPAELLSGNSASGRGFGPASAKDKAALTTGMAWNRADGKREGVAEAHGAAGLSVGGVTPEKVTFTVTYTVGGTAEAVRETYTLENGAVTVQAVFPTTAAPTGRRLTLPVLVSDGAKETFVKPDEQSVMVSQEGSTLTWEILSPKPTGPVRLEGPRLATHNGWVQAAVADLPDNTAGATYRLGLKSLAGK